MAASYELLASCTIGGVPVNKYRSTNCNMLVSIAQVEGPLVHGFFCLATEAHDDDGLPHTLEHLVFMGSEKYPYKGVLDLLANRCLAQGTNAWTDVDHTCYTITTAGSDGFLNLLPIYMDHILYPTLTDSAYITEVHHVNGDGEDAGVVYCEMQARENTSDDLTHYEMLQLMYPGKCGYKSETGGRMLNLRVSTSNEKVRSYHHGYYRPDNLCLVITGQIEASQIFETLKPFEDKILSKGPLPSFTRPWQSSVDPLESSQTKTVPFPTDEEDDGVIRICWRGPKAKDCYNMTAMQILMEYLTDTPVAPLQRDLVEVDDPYCCDVDSMELENAVSVFGFMMEGVPMDKLSLAETKVMEVLGGFSKGNETFDMERIRNILNQRIVKILDKVENYPHYFFAFALIGDFLFGDSPEDFTAYLDQVPRYKGLLEEPSTFWKNLLEKYLTNAAKITIVGTPSSELAGTIAKDEKERVEAQREKLGANGLIQKKEELDLAIKQNDIQPPSDVISSLPVPAVDSISLHPILVLCNDSPPDSVRYQTNEYKQFPVNQLPFYLQVNHIHSNFVEFEIVLDVSPLPFNLRPYLSLYTELLFESPILRDGIVIPYETVVTQLEADTINHGASIGIKRGSRFLPGDFPESLRISIKVELSKYETGVRWLNDVYYNIQFVHDRVSIVANKMMNDVNRMKREGDIITKLLIRHLTLTKDSNKNLNNLATQLKFLTQIQDKLKRGTTDVLDDLNQIKEFLTNSAHSRLFINTDVNLLSSEAWKSLQVFSKTNRATSNPLPLVPFSSSLASSTAVGRSLIAGIGGIESNYMLLCLPCINDYSHPDYPAVLVYMECLATLEGPMWRQIRGMGLSYHYSLRCSPETGNLSFCLYKSTQLVQAYSVAKEIVTNYVTGKNRFDEVQLESAKSCVIYEIVEKEDTPSSAAFQALYSHFCRVPHNHNRVLLERIRAVSFKDLEHVGEMYFRNLFDPLKISCSICCSPSKVDEIKEELEKLGHSLEVVKDVDDLAIELV